MTKLVRCNAAIDGRCDRLCFHGHPHEHTEFCYSELCERFKLWRRGRWERQRVTCEEVEIESV